MWLVWVIMATVVLKKVHKMRQDFTLPNEEDEALVTTLLWTILVFSVAVPMVGFIACCTKFQPQ